MSEWWRWSVASFPALLGKFSQDPSSTFAESGKTPKAPTSSIPSGYILLSPNSCRLAFFDLCKTCELALSAWATWAASMRTIFSKARFREVY